ncbi:heme NO-binding domain-containing protein [uncultured Paracoccus sp.]|uniref:heme NO-binding domain-containing protein n=1 Tax=uncultured Paracoccus sp. TaxID=189685 RepID=UPI0026246C4E|nr:heme NO-binding domain-containing protein [uncultured Paracoccus sp.]
MVFSELIEMADELLGEAAVDEVLSSGDFSSGGAYTSVGFYPCDEFMALVQALSTRSGLPLNDYLRRFGHWMFWRYSARYSQFFADKTDVLTMLESIETEVHIEVRKLYPGVELPRFESRRLLDGDGLELTYHSPRPLGDFCHGLVETCIEYFGRPASVERQDLTVPEGMCVRFTIRMEG